MAKKTKTKKVTPFRDKKKDKKIKREKISKGAKKEKKEKPKKEKKVKRPVLKKEVKKPAPRVRYFEAMGKRKTAIARVRLFTQGEKVFLVNEKPFAVYFPTAALQQIATASLIKMRCLDKFRVIVKVRGGGIVSQAEALRHGISRALTLFNPDFKKRLRRVGYLTRDARKRERKKFGLKRARRAPQWQKR